MPQADYTTKDRHTLKRFVLELKHKSDGTTKIYRFRVNPEDYSKEIPHRTSVLKTQSSILYEDYGQDVKTIQFSGQTGLKRRKDFDGKMKNGKDKLDELEDIINKYGNTAGSGNKSSYDMIFYNLTDDESYKVHLSPQGFKIERSSEQSLLYRYQISLVILGDAGEPEFDTIDSSNIGNNNKSSGHTSDRYIQNQTRKEEEQKARNKQAMDTIDRARGNNSTTPEGVGSLGVDSKGRTIYNPRVNTNGLEGSVSDMSLAIGYGLGGF